MFVEQLRCDYDVSELFQKMCILSPAKPTMDSGLCRNTVNTRTGVKMGLYVLPSRCCACGPQRPLLEETPERECVKVFSATFDTGLVNPEERKILLPLVESAH